MPPGPRSPHPSPRPRAGAVLLATVAGLGIALAPVETPGQAYQYVITFDNVEIRHPDGDSRALVVVHADHLRQEAALTAVEPVEDPSGVPGLPGKPPTPPQPNLERFARGDHLRRDRWVDHAEETAAAEAAAARRGVNPTAPAPMPINAATGLPIGTLTFAPGSGVVNPSFIENGFLVEAFWTVRNGRPDGHFRRAHFHPPDLSTGFEAQHWGYQHELHGLYIRAVDGKPFSLKGLRYRVTRNRQIPNRPQSIEGFNNYGIYVLVGTSFDPRRAVRPQLTAFPVGVPIGNELTLPWWRLPIFGFEYVTQVFIASSASVDLDDIVLARWEEAPGVAPEVKREGPPSLEHEPPAPPAPPAPTDTRR